jgi:hypothetical protein
LWNRGGSFVVATIMTLLAAAAAASPSDISGCHTARAPACVPNSTLKWPV